MTGPDTDRLLRAYLEEGPAVLPDRTIDAILDVVARTPRRAGGAWRAIRMPRFALAAAVAVVIAVVGAVALLPRLIPSTGNEPTGTAPASSPSTSPAAPSLLGGIIVFTRRLPGEDAAHLFSVMPDGTRFQQVRPEPACCVALPPEGIYVIFGITGGPTLTIGETNPYGGDGLGQVPNDGTVYPVGLDLIPRAVSTEFEIAFESPDGVWMSRSNGGRFAYGTFEQLATPDRGHDTPVAFSADGSKLLFIRERERAGFGDLFVVDQAGGDTRQLNPAGVEVPASDLFGPGASWSPDGTRVAFAGHIGTSGSSRVYVADIATAESTAITGAANWTTSARWSPTDDRIVFDREGIGGPHDLFIVNADGTGAVEITGDLESPCCAVWSPSGTHLLLTSGGEDEQHADLWIVAADGSGLTRLTNEPAEYQGYAWGRGV